VDSGAGGVTNTHDRFDQAHVHLLQVLKEIEADGLLTTSEALTIANGIQRGINRIAKERPSEASPMTEIDLEEWLERMGGNNGSKAQESA
jgi:hypothetical protein